MGVAAARHVRMRPSASTKRAHNPAYRPTRHPAPLTRFGARGFNVPWTMPAAREKQTAFWTRFGDDGDLLGLKVTLLAALLLVTVILEVVA